VETRWTIVPDPRFIELQGALQERMAQVAQMVQPENFAALLEPLARQVLQQGFTAAGAHEGTVWLPDAAGKHLVPGYNTGPNAQKIVSQFRQPLDAGLICMVFASEQPIVENDVFQNARQSKLLDNLLQVQTQSLIAVPFHFLRACRGVVSCVQLNVPGAAPAARGFRSDDLIEVQRASALCSQLIELRLLSQAVGWTS
jgi:hypothetical protein